MRRFWSDLLASLYNIRDGIVQKKQELDEERAACEEEKEELRGQIAELQQNQSAESIIVEPVAVVRQYEGDYVIDKFSSESVTSASDSDYLFVYDRSQFNNNNDIEMKQDKLYLVSRNSIGVKSLQNGSDAFYVVVSLLDNNENKLYNPSEGLYNIDPNNAINEDNFVLEDLFIVKFEQMA